ncbi:MAG: hypothetical protein KDC98_05685, partial [Planctomycetes bacterium]|nr:hypothetical protein [Planctomycetota bacterium]
RWQAGCASIGHALRSRWPLYLGYALVALCWWLLRTAIVGDLGDTPLREPYFVSPASAAFPVHLGVQLWSYGENLLLGAQSPPFLTASELGTFATTTGLIVTILAAATTTWFLRGERRFWFVAALAFCAWLPTSFVYVSERYLYLPSAAVAISAGLLLQRSWRHRMARTMFTLLLVVWGTNQAWTLFAKHRYLAHAPRSAWAVSALMQRLGDRLPRGAKLLFVDFPGDVVHAQFLEDQLRITLDDPDLTCRVLTLAPATTGGPIAMRRLDPHTFEVRSRGSLMTPDRVFPFVPMQPGTTVQRPRSGCAEVTVLDGDGGTLRAARFRLEDPIDDWHVIRFQPPGPRDPFFPGRWILQGRMQIVRP